MSEHLGDRFSTRRRVAIIVTLGLLTGLGPFTIDLYLPTFPNLKLDLVITDPQVQMTLSATTLGFALGQLLVGPVSDRFGRRIPLVVACAVHIIASVLVAAAPNVVFLTAMRALQGIGAAGGAVVAMAMARDLFSGKRLVVMMSRLALVNGLAPILAPVIGSWLVTVTHWRGVFWALAGYGTLVLLLLVLLIPETRTPAERTRGGVHELFQAYRRVLGDRLFLGMLGTGGFAFAGLFSYVSTSSTLLQETFGLTESQFGLVFAICSVGVFLGVQSGSRLAPRLGPQWVLVAGTAGMILAASLLLLLDAARIGHIPLIPAMFAFTLSFGCCAPNVNVLALQNHRADSGVAASLMGASFMILAASVGPIIGLFPLTSAAPMALAMLICALLSTTMLWTVARPRSIIFQL